MGVVIDRRCLWCETAFGIITVEIGDDEIELKLSFCKKCHESLVANDKPLNADQSKKIVKHLLARGMIAVPDDK